MCQHVSTITQKTQKNFGGISQYIFHMIVVQIVVHQVKYVIVL